jgi:hypothetical protein
MGLNGVPNGFSLAVQNECDVVSGVGEELSLKSEEWISMVHGEL